MWLACNVSVMPEPDSTRCELARTPAIITRITALSESGKRIQGMTHTSSNRYVFRLLALVAVSVLLLDGCAILSSHETDTQNAGLEPRSQREHRLQSTWKGRSYNALLSAYGTPKMVMGLPGYRPLDTSVVVFGVIDRASDCIDAFTVVAENPSGDLTIADYFCR